MLFLMTIEEQETRQVFVDLCNLHRDDIYWYTLSRVKNRDVADDITQDTFLKAYVYYVKNGKNECKITKALLVTIARNNCNDYFNGLKHGNKRVIDERPLEEFYDLSDINDLIEKKIIDHETKIAVKEVLDQLYSPYADILRLVFFEELEYEAIAKLLGIEVNNAYQRVYRALAAFGKIASRRSDLNE